MCIRIKCSKSAHMQLLSHVLGLGNPSAGQKILAPSLAVDWLRQRAGMPLKQNLNSVDNALIVRYMRPGRTMISRQIVTTTSRTSSVHPRILRPFHHLLHPPRLRFLPRHLLRPLNLLHRLHPLLRRSIDHPLL